MSKIKTIISSFKNRFKFGKEVFWVWVTYHCIKGMLTLSFIWIPLLILWFKSN